MVMPWVTYHAKHVSSIGRECKADYSPAKSFYDVKNLSGLIYQTILSVSNPKAKMGYQSSTESFAGYQSYLAITKERIMTAIEVKEVLADAAYSSKDHLEYLEKEGITAITPLNPIVLNGRKRDVEGFEYHKDAGQMRCPAGHLSIRKARTGKKNQTKNQSLTDYFEVERCKNCPLRKGCYKPRAKSKTYSLTIKSDIHQKAIHHQKIDEFKNKKKTTL